MKGFLRRKLAGSGPPIAPAQGHFGLRHLQPKRSSAFPWRASARLEYLKERQEPAGFAARLGRMLRR
jgi:hypothetical protein